MRRLAVAIGVAGLLCVPAVSAQADSDTGMPVGRGHHTMLVPDAKGRVVARHSVVIRSGPSTRYRAVGHLNGGRIVQIVCKVRGQRVRGNAIWYKLDTRQREWVSASYVKNMGRVPRWCRNTTTPPSLPGRDQHLRPGHHPSRPMPGQRPQATPSQSPSILPGNVSTPSPEVSVSVEPSANAQSSAVTHRARTHRAD
jgi:hypothetical protein